MDYLVSNDLEGLDDGDVAELLGDAQRRLPVLQDDCRFQSVLDAVENLQPTSFFAESVPHILKSSLPNSKGPSHLKSPGLLIS